MKTLQKHPPLACAILLRTSVYLAVKAVAVAAAYSGRTLELDSSRLNLCQEDLLWTKANLFYTRHGFRGDAADVPISTGSCPQVSRSYCYALCSCWEMEERAP